MNERVYVTVGFEPPVSKAYFREYFERLAYNLEEDRDPETTLIVSPIAGPSRRLRVRRSSQIGAPFVLEEFEWVGCAWRPVGRKPLRRVEIDGDVYDSRGGEGRCYAGP